MGVLSFVQSIWTADFPLLSQVARLDVSDAGGTPVLVLQDPVTRTQSEWQLGSAPLSTGAVRTRDTGRNATQVEIEIEGGSHRLDRATLLRLMEREGSGQAYLDETGFAGDLLALHVRQVGGQAYLVAARSAGSGAAVYRLDANGVPTQPSTVSDNSARYLGGVSAMDGITLDGRAFVVTVSALESGVNLLEIRSDGRLRQIDSFGRGEFLPINRPTAVEVVEQGGQAFALVASYGSNSLTVLEIGADGSLRFVDQALDTLGTRFAGAAALDTITVNGQVFAAIAGNDGGLSLFQMLPGGRLALLDSVVDGMLTALDGVRQLRFVERPGGIDLFALSARDAGLTRFQLDLGEVGITARGRDGTAGRDVLSALDSGQRLSAGAGDDILIDGQGRDTLTGGAGADLFVISPDAESDRIEDFNRTEDRIDLSGFGFLTGPDGLRVLSASGGASLRWGDEILTIRSHDGRSLTADDLKGRILFSDGRAVMPPTLPLLGDAGNDTFIWSEGADTIDGAAGVDTISYTNAPIAAIVDLADSSANAGAALGDTLRNIEAVTGSSHNDRLNGDDGANTLSGGAGNDHIRARGGWDWIVPGTGKDTIDGGAGRDMVSFVDLPDRAGRSNTEFLLHLDLSVGTAQTSAANTYRLISVERVTGTIHADYMKGSAGDDELRGLGDYDWFVATTGNDTLNGGNGKDMVSYVDWQGARDVVAGSVFGSGAPPATRDVAGVVVDLADTARNSALANGHSYVSIERITGSSWQDVFYGDGNSNDFRGLGGYDWFVGSTGGRERYFGGDGVDTVTYYRSASGVSAALNNGARVAGQETGRGTGGDAALDLYFEIENLAGSPYGDRLGGNAGRNQLSGLAGNDALFGYGGIDYLKGGRGNDTIDGGGGSDYALFDGNRAEYRLARTADNAVTVRGPDGTDRLIDVEYFRFDDGDIRIWDLEL
ncbi:calcium-binding protein [Ruegeria pomeroyi]|uniref:calcium-binding protein n=1 Tax=Ruegeria pomeroyi TaxID=89184 RepID=UPI001F46A3E5|nr:calcium-binding protein [Ruegeria pomeroyi]